jgi:two-component SAPR family response regulator
VNLAIITSNMLFGESLKTLLENYKFRKGRSIVVKDFTLENIEELDVLVSDYDSTKFNEFLTNTKIKKNKLVEIEKILITQKSFELLPKSTISLKRPFRIVELAEVLQSIFERMKSKRENNKVLGYISFIISDRKLIYKDKQVVFLTEKETDIFVSLLNSGDRGITKEEVMSKVWMLNPNMETHTFETHLYRLRKKIKESFFLNDFIINKAGSFYLNYELTGEKN